MRCAGLEIGAALVAALFVGGGASAAARLMTWPDLLFRPKPLPTRTVSYGDDPNQVADLWLPLGKGPFPAVVMIHGGCWQASIANHTIMNYAAEDLRKRGVAVWNIEYRATDQPGGGYPGTFRDVGAAMDRLALEAPHDDISMKRVVVVGHSAGGQLALWAAARYKLPAWSPLHWAAPQPVVGVVDIAGIPNLKTDTQTACGPEVLKKLAGPASKARRDVYADTSPSALLPLGVPQVVIHGTEDTTVPPVIGQAYVQAASAAGDKVVFHSPPGGHVEGITPGTPAWDDAVVSIKSLLRGAPA
ncbi:S9 family peptidase [Caulobacter sp. S45]|uniref:alpha/beta hydrolase family protein n=1 Tax=Caulobacter sp. S45 TaxID=1641861 RepID=UPI001575859C|nr:alpha/beta hydrolase [Caulobacter sp. S45]